MGKELKAKGETALATMNFEDEANQGFENVDNDSFAVPFLKILQKLSPQCDADKDDYREDAKPGFLFNTVTEEVINTEDQDVFIIPCFYDRNFTRWVPKDEGGGFKGTEEPSSEVVIEATRGEKGKLIAFDGNELCDTRYHYCIMQIGSRIETVLITMGSTQIRKSKAWMSMMNSIKIDGKNGRFTPPSFSHRYKVSTKTETKGDNSWKGWKIEMAGMLTDIDAELYLGAKKFRDQIKGGKAKVVHDEESTGF